jgi:hypothetical protein
MTLLLLALVWLTALVAFVAAWWCWRSFEKRLEEADQRPDGVWKGR